MSTGSRVFLPTYDQCYVCGQHHPRGLRVRFFTGPQGQVHAEFQPDDTQTGYEGIVHGGVISALMDELLGWPIVLQTARMCFTGELTVEFLRPVHAGHSYLATASPGLQQRQHWEGHGDLRDGGGKICARARGRYTLLSEAQTAAVAARLTYQPDDLPIFRHPTAGGDRV